MQVRIKVGALGRAFSARSDERQTSVEAHKLSMGTFAVENALQALFLRVSFCL